MVDLLTSRAQYFSRAQSGSGRFFYVFYGKCERERAPTTRTGNEKFYNNPTPLPYLRKTEPKDPRGCRFSSSTTPKTAVILVAIVLAGIAWSTGQCCIQLYKLQNEFITSQVRRIFTTKENECRNGKLTITLASFKLKFAGMLHADGKLVVKSMVLDICHYLSINRNC